MLRRVNEAQTGASAAKSMVFDDLRIDPNSREVTIRDIPVTPPAREFELLRHMASHPRRVYTRDELMETGWGYALAGDTSTVTVHMRRLREKIEPDPARPRYLQTVWGTGSSADGEDVPGCGVDIVVLCRLPGDRAGVRRNPVWRADGRPPCCGRLAPRRRGRAGWRH